MCVCVCVCVTAYKCREMQRCNYVQTGSVDLENQSSIPFTFWLAAVTTGNRIKYMAVSVNTTLRLQSLGYTQGIPIVERWEQFMKDQV